MRSVLMLGPVRGIAEGFRTARKLAHVRLLSGVRSEMSLQILQPRVRLWAAFKLIKTQRCNFNIIPTYIVWDALLSIFIKFLNTLRYRHYTWQVTSIFLKFNTHYKEIYFIYYTEGLGSNINIYFIFSFFWTWGYKNTTYCALVRFLPCVAPHVHHQHVLSLERFLLPTAFLPATDEHLLVGLYVIYIYMLQWKINVHFDFLFSGKLTARTNTWWNFVHKLFTIHV